MTSESTGDRRRPRIALYGHDTVGLGHLRRNLTLARTLAGPPVDADVLVVAGVPEAALFPRPDGVDVVTLPTVAKDASGGYVAGGLGIPLEEVVAIRSAVLRAALGSFAPDLLVVDKVALGLGGELAPALRRLRSRFGTRTVLGLRDVLDDPRVARTEWRRLRTTEVLREHYDEVWVYGDPAVHDLADACHVPPGLRAVVHHVGYLADGRTGSPVPPPGPAPGTPYVVGLVGGGQDGRRLATALAGAAGLAGVPHVVLVAGPYLPATTLDTLRRSAGPALTVVRFATEPERWLAGAEAVVSMGGYNTVAEVLTTPTPALLVPRTTPRLEQWVRAERLAAMGLVDVLHPADLEPGRLARWVAEAAGRRVPRAGRLDLGGLAAVARRAAALLPTSGRQEVARATG
ncbi:MAG TPA: glycosyltransferase [Jiangellales bacterium]|nr:glycosyltransferase [Jiangellales bacterium]